MTKAPATITYTSVVSRETIRIALLMAALNDLNVKVENVLNAYITAPITERVWTVFGLEFGIDASKSAIIVRTLYGLKRAGAVGRRGTNQLRLLERYLDVLVKHTTEIPPPTA